MDSSEKVKILDGGLSTELERSHGFTYTNDPLWSSRALSDKKGSDSIRLVHESYLQHGADVITTASYQASVPGFQKHLGLSAQESEELIRFSVRIALEAKDSFNGDSKGKKPILVAGSVGPYGAALADGSEYTGNYSDTLTVEEIIDWHKPRIECLIGAGVDLLALETIPSEKEAEALLLLLKSYPSSKAWLSFSCQSPHKTAHGEDIGTSVANCLKVSNQLVAIGVNCCQPDHAVSLLQDIDAQSLNFPLIVYPNSGELWDSQKGWSGSSCLISEEYLEKYLKCNVKYIGGCCRTTPEDILSIFNYVHGC